MIVVEQSPASETVDWAALLAFIHSAFAFMDTRIDPPSSLHRFTAEALKQKAQDEVLFLIREGDKLVGCAFCCEENGFTYVGKVAVAAEYQGQGIGRRLFEACEDFSRKNGYAAIELETRIELVENHKAFSRLGFEKCGESAHEGYDRPTSIRMRKELLV